MKNLIILELETNNKYEKCKLKNTFNSMSYIKSIFFIYKF